MNVLTELGDRVARGLGAWLTLAVVLILACYGFGLRFPEARTGDLLAARLALLGLVGAIATFQYGTWEGLAARAHERIHDPRWLQAERELERDQLLAEANVRSVANIPERQAGIEAWHARRDEDIQGVLTDILPHNRAVLTNYLAAAYCLLVSTLMDLLGLLLRAETAVGGAVAGGALIASIPPFIDVWRRYAGGLSGEFRSWEKAFREARRQGGQR